MPVFGIFHNTNHQSTKDFRAVRCVGEIECERTNETAHTKHRDLYDFQTFIQKHKCAFVLGIEYEWKAIWIEFRMHGVCALFYFDLILKRKYKYLVNFAMVGVFWAVYMDGCALGVQMWHTLDYTRSYVYCCVACCGWMGTRASANRIALLNNFVSEQEREKIDEKLQKWMLDATMNSILSPIPCIQIVYIVVVVARIAGIETINIFVIQMCVF